MVKTKPFQARLDEFRNNAEVQAAVLAGPPPKEDGNPLAMWKYLKDKFEDCFLHELHAEMVKQNAGGKRTANTNLAEYVNKHIVKWIKDKKRTENESIVHHHYGATNQEYIYMIFQQMEVFQEEMKKMKKELLKQGKEIEDLKKMKKEQAKEIEDLKSSHNDLK